MASGTIDEYEFSMEIDIPVLSLSDNEQQIDSNETNNSQIDSEMSNESDHYKVTIDEQETVDNLPIYPIDNLHFDVNEKDTLEGWIQEDIDSGSCCGPFLSSPSTIIDLTDPVPELFFNQLFDDRMWTIILDATNTYARSKANTLEGNRFRDPTNPHYRTHCRINKWTDITPSDLKIFIADNIIMGLVKKSDLEKYWSITKMIRLPLFGKYLSRNRFQSILWNLHICNDGENPPFQHHGHDPLAKLCPFISMIETNIMHLYKPEKNISIDEACYPFKGRL